MDQAMAGKRLPNAVHESGPWRVREIVPDFILEDVWALPVSGRAGEMRALLDLMSAASPADLESWSARALWRLRDLLGKWFDLGRISATAGGSGDAEMLSIPGTNEASLAGRLPDDLRGTAADLNFDSLPFVPLFLTETEFAAELSNRTVHGVMHLAWVDQGDGRYQGQMAVYVKPNGRLGTAYMALIKPFRYLIVYPALMRQTERMWNQRPIR